ncbi:MAG: aldehyde dehydrogenase family protein [Desulfocucumaceae bacterium]
MELDQAKMTEIIRRVLAGMNAPEAFDREENGIFSRVDDAVEAAWMAQKRLSALNVEKRREFVGALRQAAIANNRLISEMVVRESGMGRVGDKVIKNDLAARKTPGTEDLATEAFTGDRGLTIVEQAPFGVIGAITPVTNPIATIINNSIGMLAAGNTVVFNPHPGARLASLKMIEIFTRALAEVGAPPHLLNGIANPTIETASAIMKNRKVSLLVATGGPAVVRAVLSSGKKAIGAGAGNPPVVVDATADLPKAARDIIAGASFDNNLPCIAEKEIIVVDGVADGLIENLSREGALILPREQIEQLTQAVFTRQDDPDPPDYGPARSRPKWLLNKELVGKDAWVILEAAGIKVNGDPRLVVAPVGRDHPLVQEEQLMPVIPLVRVSGVEEAIELAVEVEHGYRHTAIMHSKHVDHMTRLARSIQTTVFVKNAPSFAGIGSGGEGFTTFTIAGPTGEGLTSARSFTRKRRCVLVDALSIV